MITKYRTSGWGSLIEKVEVTKETDKSVWLGVRREAKVSEYQCYFDTWDQAKAHVVSKAEAKLKAAKSRFDSARSHLERVKSMKKPQEEKQ